MKLYETNSYIKENVTSVKLVKSFKGAFWVSFEDTIFFPEEGGQNGDTGYILIDENKIVISDSQIDNEIIWHKLESDNTELINSIVQGTKVKCFLDFEKRFMRMQNHTGEHILTGLIHNRFGYVNKGFHLSDTAPVTLDCSGVLSDKEVAEMEILANELVSKNVTVKDSYPTEEELKSIDYRSKIEIKGQVRLITIGDEEIIDICACCAPHVSKTGEVGIIKVISFQNYKGGTRLSILCGSRAVKYIQEEHERMMCLSRMFSTGAENVLDCVKDRVNEISELKQRLAVFMENSLKAEVDKMEVSENCCLICEKDLSPVVIKNLFNYMKLRFSGFVGVFSGTDEEGYYFNAGSENKDSKILFEKMKKELDAKGGGNDRMVQGKTSSGSDSIRLFFDNCCD